MNKTAISVVGIIIILLIGWYVFAEKGMIPGMSDDKPITIGFIGPLTGDAVSYGEPISNSIRLAVDEVNEDGGINGRMLEVVYEDGKCTGKEAVNAAQKLVNVDKVNVIIGGVCSGEALAILPLTEPAKVLVLSPSASSPDLTGAGEYFFRNNPSDDSGGSFLADIVLKDHKKVAVISENTDYAQALRGVFTESFTAGGGEVVADESFAPETKDFRSILTKVKAAAPDAIFINPQTEDAGGIIGKQIKELDIEGQLYGSNILSGAKAVEIGGDNIEGLLLFDSPGLNPNNRKAAAFLDNYQEQYGDLSIEFYLGAAYDAVHILAKGMKKVGTDSDALRDYIDTMTRYSGVIGAYSFDDNGDLTGIDHVLKKIEEGKPVTVE